MSKNDYVLNTVYSDHVQNKRERRFLNSPTDNRQGLLERFYIRKLTEMCITRFKWEGVPPSVDTLFMERTLFYNSLSVFLFDPRFGEYMAVRGTISGAPNYTDNPTRFRLFGTGGYPTTLIHARNCVPIWGSISRLPDTDVVSIYARKLAEIDRSIEINAENARRTKVIIANQDSKLTMANVVNSLHNGDPAIYVAERDQAMSAHEKVETIDLGIDVAHVERLHILKVRLWNECMTYLGIDGGNQDKKERQITSEVEANEEQVNLIKETALLTRKIAADEINRKYCDLNVSVSYNTDGTQLPTLMGV